MNKSQVFYAATMLLACCAGAQDTKKADVAKIPIQQHRLESDKRFAEQDKIMEKSRQAAKDGKYDKAIELLEGVWNELELENSSVDSWKAQARFREVDKELKSLRQYWSGEKLREAKIKAFENELNSAITLATTAIAIDSRCRTEAEAIIKRCQDAQRNAERQAEFSMKKTDPDSQNNKEKIERLLTEARVFIKKNRFDDALKRVEQVYQINPFNAEAVALAGRIYRLYYTSGFHRHRADSESLLAFSQWQWVEPVFLRDAEASKVSDAQVRSVLGEDGIASKLDQIILDIQFDKTSLPNAFEFLEGEIKDKDIPDKKGVPITLALGARQDSGNMDLTLNLSGATLREVLDYICLMKGLKYQIRKDDVIVGVEGQLDDMVSETAKISADLVRLISGTAPASGDGEAGAPAENTAPAGGGDDGGVDDISFGDIGSGGSSEGKMADAKTYAGIKVSPGKLRGFFQKYGIKFPSNSEIFYNRRKSELRFRNTRENIQAMKKLLLELEALDRPLILVELKNIDITESDYQELGFNWTLGPLSSDALNPDVPINGDGSIDIAKGKSSAWGAQVGRLASYNHGSQMPSGAFTNLRESVNVGTHTLVNNLNLFPTLLGSVHPFGSDTSLNLSLSISALNQSGRSEIMSAPKVLTSSGTSANVHLTQYYYFPDSWDELEVEEESNENSTWFSITPPVPTFDEKKELGVIFSVKPTILGDSRTIRLELDSTVSGYTISEKYKVGVVGYKIEGDKRSPFSFMFYIYRPDISTNQFKATLDVYDGETVVFGGMVENKTIARLDKIPFLGDLPFIGRLFQSHSENTQRRNQLLFVTARRVTKSGVPVKTHVAGGMPDFNR